MIIIYSIENFERPSVASDCVVFGLDSIEPDSPRSLKQRKLKILLVKRGEEPFINRYSLAGGFLRKGETIEETALRELKEEAGVSDPKIINLGIYSSPERDPRGWIISCAFLALTRTVKLSTADYSDALDAHWLDFEYANETITLSDGTEEIVIHYKDGQPEKNVLAFDHAKIIYDAFMKLRDEVIHHDIVFDLMPSMFAISDLQQPYEIITGKKTSPQNFRKKMSSKIRETDVFDTKSAHRTSKLYERIPQEELL
ncbi:MAG: NUDIX hydrolase [Ruminococcus sp.]|nr:NUDIX hydrolase [Ruminococcus sp.]